MGGMVTCLISSLDTPHIVLFQSPVRTSLFSKLLSFFQPHSYTLLPLLEMPFPTLPSGVHLFILESSESLSLVLREFLIPQIPRCAHSCLSCLPRPCSGAQSFTLLFTVSLLPQPRRPKSPGVFLCVPSCLQGPVKAWPGQVGGYTQLGEVAMPRDPCCPLTRALV